MTLFDQLRRLFHIPYLLHIDRRGKQGPWVIFLHGIAAQGDVWNPVIAPLTRHNRCIQVDLLGHGKSPKPTWVQYNAKDHARSLRWTLFFRGIWGKKIFVGHSMGGLVALRYARRSPRSVRSLILLALPVYRRSEVEEQSRHFEARIDRGYLVFYRTLRSLPKPAAIRSARALVRLMPRLAGTASLDADTWYPVVSSMAHTIEDQTALTDLEHIPATIPLTLIYGRLDQLVLIANLKLIKQNHPATKLVPIISQHEIGPTAIRPIVRAVNQTL